METILTSVAALSADPKAWAVAALVALKAAHSVFLSLRCPVMRGTATVTTEMIEAGRRYRFAPPASFLIVMLIGIGLAVGGLYLLHDSKYGPLALGALAIGMFMFLTAPARLFVRAAIMGVFATTGADGDTNYLARDRLRAARLELTMFEVIIAAAILALLWLF